MRNLKLKLHDNESILPKNPHIELEVRLKLHKLGITKWINDDDVLHHGGFCCYPLAIKKGKLYLKLSHDNEISGTEWLDRHGISVTGQKRTRKWWNTSIITW